MDHLAPAVLLLFLLSLEHTPAAAGSHLLTLIGGLAKMGNFQVHIISDPRNDESQQLSQAVNIPTVLHSLGAEDDGTIPGLPLATGCDGDWDGHVVGNPDAAIRPKLIFAWPSDLQQTKLVLGALNASAKHCPVERKTGLYSPDNFILFYHQEEEGNSTMSSQIAEEVFSDFYVKRHRRAAFFRPLGGSNGSALLMSRYNIYTDRAFYSSVWHPRNNDSPDLQKMFSPLDMEGYQFRISNMPYDFLTYANDVPDPVDERHLWENRRGFEIVILEEVCHLLNCTLDYANPPDLSYGDIANGHYTGYPQELADGLVDIIAGGFIITYITTRGSQYSVGTLMDGCSFLAPKPDKYRSMLTILHPLSSTVWFLILLSLLSVQTAMYFMSRGEASAAQLDLRQWTEYPRASWYTFGTLLGESITRDTKSQKAWGLRLLSGVWFGSALLMTASYGGNLRAHLLAPSYKKPIDNMQDIVESGLPWLYVIYGNELETHLATSTDPVEQSFWSGKRVVDMELFPYKNFQKAYRGEGVFIEFKHLVDTTVAAGFTRSNGYREVHVPSSGFLTSVNKGPDVWVFYPFNPWFHRFNSWLRRFHETGLFDIWEAKTRYELMQIYRAQMEPLPLAEEGEGRVQMSMGDLRAAFLCACALCLASCLVFLGEAAAARSNRFLQHQQQQQLDHNAALVGYRWRKTDF